MAYTLLPLWTLLPEPKGSNFLKAVLAYMQVWQGNHMVCPQTLLSAAAAAFRVESVYTAAVRLHDFYACQPIRCAVRAGWCVSPGMRASSKAHVGRSGVVCRIVLVA